MSSPSYPASNRAKAEVRSGKPGIAHVVLIVLAVLLTGVNVFLLRQNSQFRARLAADAPLHRITLGLKPPPLRGFDVRGNPVTLTYGEDRRSTLLLAFSPDCGVCQTNWPTWLHLLDGIDRPRYRVVFVNVTRDAKPAEYPAKFRLSGEEVVANVDGRSILDYRIEAVPQTILLDAQGVASKVWQGLLNEESQR